MPLELIRIPIMDILYKLENEKTKLFPYDIVLDPIFIELLEQAKYLDDVLDQFKIGHEYGWSTGNPLMNELNNNKSLVKKLKKLTSLTHTMNRTYNSGLLDFGLFSSKNFQSERFHVSMMFIPFNEVTYFQISHNEILPKKVDEHLKSFFDTITKNN